MSCKACYFPFFISPFLIIFLCCILYKEIEREREKEEGVTKYYKAVVPNPDDILHGFLVTV